MQKRFSGLSVYDVCVKREKNRRRRNKLYFSGEQQFFAKTKPITYFYEFMA